MRGSFTASVAFALLASVVLFSTAAVGQDASGIPACAISCFIAAVPASHCSLDDRVCQCTTGRDAIQRSVAQCAPKVCGPDDLAKIKPAVKAICLQHGITLDALPPTPSPAAASTAMPSVQAATTGVASNGTANTTTSGGVPKFTNGATAAKAARDRGGWVWAVGAAVGVSVVVGMGIRIGGL
ncbi:uncharacterized protein EI97DRAFT_454985 [Westerdykella ornata]|uniref:CFEM domain-containing protein n=1 Tax=Westerdykella ornata TaxID=318751 RepID=A0A6A6JUJ5_WESOR|nr:uncharacterized protein EI97DRAFT_454985 [Westerdykella ornata]KAF2280057.1 hypothetical protein EI97DRAFT_454985 [Westerdykella ornata]